MPATRSIDKYIKAEAKAACRSRHSIMARQKASAADSPVLAAEPKRTEKLFSPNASWLMLLIQ